MTVIDLLDQTVAKLNRLCRKGLPNGVRVCSDCGAIEMGDIEGGRIEQGETIHHKPRCGVLMLTTNLRKYRARLEDVIKVLGGDFKAKP